MQLELTAFNSFELLNVISNNLNSTLKMKNGGREILPECNLRCRGATSSQGTASIACRGTTSGTDPCWNFKMNLNENNCTNVDSQIQMLLNTPAASNVIAHTQQSVEKCEVLCQPYNDKYLRVQAVCDIS